MTATTEPPAVAMEPEPSGLALRWRRWRNPRWFLPALLVVVALSGVVRLVGAETGTSCRLVVSIQELNQARNENRCISFNDAAVYRDNAKLNVDGKWFQANFPDGKSRPTALHAPLYTLVLTPFVAAGIDRFDALQRTLALLGCVTVAAAGLLMRRLAGPAVGVVAAALVAFHPLLWINDVVLMPEGLFALVVVGVIALGFRFHADPSWRRAAALGAGIGVATLTRNEAVLAVAFMALPLALGHVELPLRDRLARWGAVAGVCVLVLVPWFLFNWARFDQPLFTTGTGVGMRSGTCDEPFYDSDVLGLRSIDCLQVPAEDADRGLIYDEVGTDRYNRDRAVAYYRDNLGRTPVVLAARAGRLWSVWRPFQTVRLDDVIEQRGIGRSEWGIVVGWLLLPASVYGAVVLFRRRVPLSPFLTWVASSTLLAVANTPLLRFRGAADLSLALLAAVGLVELWERFSPWPARRPPAAPRP